MTTPPEQTTAKPRRRGLALVWAEPLAVVIGVVTWIPTGIALCGISGCGGGGFGVSWNPVAGVIGLAISGVIVALPIVLVRWTANRALRWAVGAVAGLLFAAAGWLYLWPAVIPTR